eukprot:1194409-Prorocentrum_minimum.AAC.1
MKLILKVGVYCTAGDWAGTSSRLRFPGAPRRGNTRNLVFPNHQITAPRRGPSEVQIEAVHAADQ